MPFGPAPSLPVGPASAGAAPSVTAASDAASALPGARAASVPPVASAWPWPTDLRAALGRWLPAQRPRLYWRVLAGGVVVLFLVWYLLLDKLQLGVVVPFYDLGFGLLLPAVVVLYWWEQGAPALAPRDALLTALAGGAVAGLVAALVFYDVLNLGGNSLLDAIAVAVLMETLKVGAVAYLLRDARLRRELDGLILAFVAMLGFSALQTAAYSFITFLQTNNAGFGLPGFSSFRPALANMDSVLAYQLLSQLCGDWVWTATLCAAIWRERGAATFALTRGVGIAFGIVVVLHALWTYSLTNDWLKVYLPLRGYLPIFTLLVGLVGLLVLSFFLRESRERAALGPDAPTPPPLEQALPAYFSGLGRRT